MAPLSISYLREWRVVPDPEPCGRVRLLCAAVLDPQVVDELRWYYQREPVIELVDPERLEAALARATAAADPTADQVIASLRLPASDGDDDSDSELIARAQDAPVVQLVNLLLLEALRARASDVHLERVPDGLRVRYRVDGMLRDAASPPRTLAAAVIGRLKVLADLDVAERRRPQDGRVRLRVEGRALDARVSTMPTLHGECVVLRLLEADGRRLGLAELGMDVSTRTAFEGLIGRPNGVVLATGPTGSGKTTTLYGALQHLRTGREKIVTVEDPVEYAIEGVLQVPVNRKADLGFASALRSILRHDPDLLLVGEMRDGETAAICTQAALTGHLVLSTLHTNDAPSALVRLQELGIEPFLVASTVAGVLAQRLVRVICPGCAEDREPTPAVAAMLATAGWAVDRVRLGNGCTDCAETGFRGRIGIYELLKVDPMIRHELLRRRGADAIRELALRSGMRALRVDGLRHVAAGLTTAEEVLRVTQGEEPAG